MTSKGQVTVPKAVRDALGLSEGDEVVFRVEGNRAMLARTPDFLDLAATVRVPAAKRNVAWDEVIRRARADRAAKRR
jgi:AbrB family looped-hinge helix DNA binding protein